MKQYKLIKIYPNSPKLGTIVTYYANWNMYGITNECIFKADVIENSPEFWEKVLQKEYEILSFSFKNIEFIRWKNKYGYFPHGEKNDNNRDNEFSEKALLNDCCYNIHSVKRLSDGEIFTIGDKIDFNCNGVAILKEIHMSTAICDKGKDILCFVSESSYLGKWWNINDLIKVKQPIFLTEDGVDIFEGDNYFSINEKYWRVEEPKNTCKINYETYHKNQHNFSTKEKAEEYIIMNKPCLSINDIIKSFNNPGTSIINPLKELIKSKI